MTLEEQNAEISVQWPIFQENNKVFTLHFCGPSENFRWFRRVIADDTGRLKCEFCNSGMPQIVESLLKLEESKLQIG